MPAALISTQSEERENCDNYDDETNQINDTVHGEPLAAARTERPEAAMVPVATFEESVGSSVFMAYAFPGIPHILQRAVGWRR
jgi:hypothetical protein